MYDKFGKHFSIIFFFSINSVRLKKKNWNLNMIIIMYHYCINMFALKNKQLFMETTSIQREHLGPIYIHLYRV